MQYILVELDTKPIKHLILVLWHFNRLPMKPHHNKVTLTQRENSHRIYGIFILFSLNINTQFIEHHYYFHKTHKISILFSWNLNIDYCTHGTITQTYTHMWVNMRVVIKCRVYLAWWTWVGARYNNWKTEKKKS